MANSWFRLYAEFAHDAKVQMMGECEQRRLIMLFCIRCNGDVGLDDEEIAFQLRIDLEEWLITKAKFIAKGFLSESNEILNWDKRQFVTGEANFDAVSKSSNYVYFVADSSQSVVNQDYYVVKIGISKNPWARLKDLQTANSSKLEIVAKFHADIISEAAIHELLRQFRVNGEWFKVPSNLASKIIEHGKDKSSNYVSVCSLIVDSLRSKATVATVTTTDTEQIQIQNTDKNKYIPPIGAELLSDWMEVRKAKRAGKLTKTAFAGIEREASKAGISAEQAIKICCERGWAGFKADWMTSAKQPAKSSGNQSAVDRRIDIANQMFGSITGGNNGRVIEHG